MGGGGSEETDQLDDAAPALDDQPQVDQEGDATEAMTVADLDDFEQSVEEPTSEFRFSFDDERS